jgi:hypothetical protein
MAWKEVSCRADGRDREAMPGSQPAREKLDKSGGIERNYRVQVTDPLVT